MTLDDLLDRINIDHFWIDISQRSDFTWQHVQKYPNVRWSAWAIYKIAPLEYIMNNPTMSWPFDYISERPDLTIPFIRHFSNKLDWFRISENIDFHLVIENPDLPWDYDGLSSNKKITTDDIIENTQIKWNFKKLSKHIDINFIYANTTLPWDDNTLLTRLNLNFIRGHLNPKWLEYSEISSNPNLTIDFILEYPSFRWHWESVYSTLKLEDIIKHNLQLTDFEAFQRAYPNYCVENYEENILYWTSLTNRVTLDILEKYPNKPWTDFSYNKNMTMNFVLKHPEIDWGYKALSGKNQINLQDVLDNWDKPWDIESIIKFKF